MTRMINTTGGNKTASSTSAIPSAAVAGAAGSNAQQMNAMKKPQTNSKHLGAVRVHFEQTVQTKQLTPTRLSSIDSSDVEVNVTDGVMEQKSGFLSGSKHWLSYKIKIPICSADVRRKDEDFDLLQEYLIKTYPNVIVPTTKRFKGDKYNE